MSVCRLAFFQSGTERVYSSQRPSGLTSGFPICRMYCMSRKVMGRDALATRCCAAATDAKRTSVERAARRRRAAIVDMRVTRVGYDSK
jgi:hypothetical protein